MPGLTAPQAAIAQAGANLMETGINALATGSANRATRKWNEKCMAYNVPTRSQIGTCRTSITAQKM